MHHVAPMYALFLGPAFVLRAVSESWQSRVFGDPPIGLPVSEAWADPAWQPVQRLMRQVYETGVPARIQTALGPGYIVAVRQSGQIVGVATRLEPTAPTLLSPSTPVGSAARQ